MAYNIIEYSDFLRRYVIRSNSIMWFLGAGASAAAGIPTAWNMVLDFKQQLYASHKKISVKSVGDLSNSDVQNKLDHFIKEHGRLPEAGHPDEYAALFETTYPSESDRQVYLDTKLKGAKPSYGHMALATLMSANRLRVVWTTNFDSLIADACAKIYGSTGHLTTATLDTPNIARDAVIQERWPLEIKIHGDFRSRRLKNTTSELREQDGKLRKLLVELCGRSGMVVAGYSGRDESVMSTLIEALDKEASFPNGLFWLHHGEAAPLEYVQKVLTAAKEKGVDGGLVSIENFDEVLRDLVKLLPDLDTALLDGFASERRIWSPPTKPGNKGVFPVVRLNALHLDPIPSLCRKVECTIGGHSEVIEAIKKADVPVIATRKRDGVIAFGADHDVKAAFAPFDIKKMGVYTIEKRRLRYDSQERGLIRRALSAALVRERALRLHQKGRNDLFVPQNDSDPCWEGLKSIVQGLSGCVPNHPEILWYEGIGVRLDWASDRLWLLFEPRTVFDGLSNENKSIAADFARERTVKRYNRQLGHLFDFWSSFIAGDGSQMLALGITTGFDAAFQINPVTAYSMRWIG